MSSTNTPPIYTPSKEKQNECLDAILHHQEHTYAKMKPDVYNFCMVMWMEQENKLNQTPTKSNSLN